MAGNIWLFMAGFKPDALAFLKTGLFNKPGVEMVIAVDKPADAENKINRRVNNVLLIDMDTLIMEKTVLSVLQSRYGFHILYTSYNRARAGSAPGGVDSFILKPSVFTSDTSAAFIAQLLKSIEGFRKQVTPPNIREINKMISGSKKVIAIASSTGGTNALECILADMPADAPPMVVVQHMPSGFTKLFADRINALFRMEIKEASTGDYLKQGLMLLAPADKHMKLVRQQSLLAVECFTGTKMHGVMPAADILFESVAELVKNNAIGVILTGMGADGARGMMLMHNAGAKTIGQNKESCVVYGMPKVAKDLGAIDFELPIEAISDKILSLV